ncbi:MAG: spinster family MFS transporter [Planctomycetota bacterium]
MSDSPLQLSDQPMIKHVPILTVTILSVINLFNYIDRYIISANLVPISTQLGFAQSETLKGLLQSAFMVSFVIMAPVFGCLQPFLSRPKLIAAGVMMWTLASGASGIAGLARTEVEADLSLGLTPPTWAMIAGTYGFLLASRCFVGIGEAAFGPAAPALLSDWYSEGTRGKVMAILYTAVPVGSAMGFALGGLIGWPWSFFFVVPPGIGLSIACWFLPENPSRKDRIKAETIHLDDYFYLAKCRSYVINVAAYTAATFCIGGIAYWLPTYISETRKAVNGDTGSMMIGLIIVISGLIATIAGALLADQLKNKDSGAYFKVCAWGMYLAFPAMIGVVFAPFPLAWVCLFIACIGLFLNTGPANTILMNVMPAKLRGLAMAVCIFVIHALGDVISPTLIGVAGDCLPGGLDAGFLIVTFLVLVAGLIWHSGAIHLKDDMETAKSFDGN